MSTNPPLISAAALAGLGNVARTAMQTPVVISRRNVEYKGTTIVADDLGDDDVVFNETSESFQYTLYGSFSSTPNPVQVEEDGALVTVNTYKLILPSGTDVRPGDIITVGSAEYTVSDTTGESTWQALLVLNLRKIE